MTRAPQHRAAHRLREPECWLDIDGLNVSPGRDVQVGQRLDDRRRPTH